MDGIVAFLATRLSAARIDIGNEWTIMSVSGPDRGEVIYDGATRSFRIITSEDQLRGMRLHAFEVLFHATGAIDSRMLDLARARVRHDRPICDETEGDCA